MSKLIELAKKMHGDDVGFIEYMLLHELEEKEKYPARDVFVTLLGRSHRAYQYWEKQPGYPVPNPAREPTPPTSMGRVYTPEEVVEIAWWWWENMAIEKRGRCAKRKGGGGGSSEIRA